MVRCKREAEPPLNLSKVPSVSLTSVSRPSMLYIFFYIIYSLIFFLPLHFLILFRSSQVPYQYLRIPLPTLCAWILRGSGPLGSPHCGFCTFPNEEWDVCQLIICTARDRSGLQPAKLAPLQLCCCGCLTIYTLMLPVWGRYFSEGL